MVPKCPLFGGFTVVQAGQVCSHNMVPYACLPCQVGLKELYKYTSMCIIVNVVLWLWSRSKTLAGVYIAYTTAVTTSVMYLWSMMNRPSLEENPNFLTFILRKCAGFCKEMSRKVYTIDQNVLIPRKL